MLLSQIEVTDFLSVRGTIKIDFDRKVTILLGSNDHGKSNVLEAVKHLNDATPITQEETNWDAEGAPRIGFTFTLSPAERKEWKEIIEQVIERRAAILREREDAAAMEDTVPATTAKDGPSEAAAGTTVVARAKPTPTVTVRPSESEDEDETDEEELDDAAVILPQSALDPAPATLVLARDGVGEELKFAGIEAPKLPEEMRKFIVERKPRVELFKAFAGNLQDSANSSSINKDEYEFLQGVFFYAGIDPRTSEPLFSQSDKTIRALDRASTELDRNLRKLWGQGTELHFELRHWGTSIEFLADDPAIKTRKARMSKRSAGVTQFFRVSMVLYARRKKNPANSYIYLFDEPGVLLHPQGQRDLLQVFEQLADENQIVYATHSLFLLNQNFPERHRLIFKDGDGTKVDQKPYRQNWKLATDALGVYLTSNVLFSNRVLLVEGDSDPIYVYELFRQLNRTGDTDVDLNSLGIMSFSDHQNLRFLLQVFKREEQDTSVLVITDGDTTGKGMLQRVSALCKRLGVPMHRLPEGRSIEDLCLVEDAFLKAVERALRVACEAEGKNVPADLAEKVRKSWEAHRASAEKVDKRQKPEKGDAEDEKRTAGRWLNDVSKELIEDEASKVVVARTYAEICRSAATAVMSKERLKDAKALCQEIADKLKLPPVKAMRTFETK